MRGLQEHEPVIEWSEIEKGRNEMKVKTPNAKDQTTMIFVKPSTDPSISLLLGIEFTPEPVEYIKKHANVIVTESFSDSDREIDTNGYLVGDEDHRDHGRVAGSTIVLVARDMTKDEIEEYEDERDAADSEFARDQMAEFDAFDRSINS
jgi:hypothetical protein